MSSKAKVDYRGAAAPENLSSVRALINDHSYGLGKLKYFRDGFGVGHTPCLDQSNSNISKLTWLFWSVWNGAGCPSSGGLRVDKPLKVAPRYNLGLSPVPSSARFHEGINTSIAAPVHIPSYAVSAVTCHCVELIKLVMIKYLIFRTADPDPDHLEWIQSQWRSVGGQAPRLLISLDFFFMLNGMTFEGKMRK